MKFDVYRADSVTLMRYCSDVWEKSIDTVGFICHRERKEDAGLLVQKTQQSIG